MIVVTGAAGFIGNNLVTGLNNAHYKDIVLIEDFSRADRERNYADKHGCDDSHELVSSLEPFSPYARSKNEFDRWGLSLDHVTYTFQAMELEPSITFIDTPEDIRKHYQYFTEANMIKLRATGYSNEFAPHKKGITEHAYNYLGINVVN